MLIKYKLLIRNSEHELSDNDLKNWDEIKCVYKRVEYGGVVRSFTSKFEFVNNAYRIILSEYERYGFLAKVTVLFYVIDNNWNYDFLHSCDLDFSTLIYNEYVLSINAIDSSVSNKIKANKSTKFEFVVGEDIAVGSQYMFDRLKMIETVTYSITGGTSRDDGSLYGKYTPDQNNRLYVGLTSDEISIGGVIDPQEDQVYENGFMIKARKATTLTLDYSIVAGTGSGCAELQLMKNDTLVHVLHEEVERNMKELWLGLDNEFDSIESVMNIINSSFTTQAQWRDLEYRGYSVNVQGKVWEVSDYNSLGSAYWFNTGKTVIEYRSRPSSGTITINVEPQDKIWLKFNSDYQRMWEICSSSLKFSWIARDVPVLIDTISPDELLRAILWRMGVGTDVVISSNNNLFNNTLILPAESIRAIPGARIYTSFDDFCKWIETVFGFTYVIDDDYGIIEFKHRNEIFSKNADIIKIDDAKDFEYRVDSSVLYSSIIIGYDKKDYDSVNGRDEFNFNSSYMTEYTNNGKKLELKSPFRADSYGIEFLVLKRNQDTTDNSSDKDVFFVSGIKSGNIFHPNRSVQIQNSITGTLLNGEFNPMNCITANKEYISLMADSLLLTFASTDGNSDIIIGGLNITDDIQLEDCEMLTPGELKFSCGNLIVPKDLNCLIEVKSKNYIYTGFIKQASFTLARPEAVEYTLMIKTKMPC